MQTRLVPMGNSFGIPLPESVIKRFDLDKNDLEIIVKEEGILITPIPDMPPLSKWDQLFEDAEKSGFKAEADAEDFKDWDITMSDGVE